MKTKYFDVLDEESQIWIQCYCWFYSVLSNNKKKIFLSLLEEFIKNNKFVGIGISITNEIKIAVSGWAVLLILNRPLGNNWYTSIERISIYPGNFVKTENALGLVASGYSYCQIHLAWGDIRDSSTKAFVDRNTILHEFAHVLDHIDRAIDGHPRVLLTEKELVQWKTVFSKEYIHGKPVKERDKLWNYFGLDAWNKFDPDDSACVDVGEFFAVSTELFFETPNELQLISPDIYECLSILYRCNPIVDYSKSRLVD